MGFGWDSVTDFVTDYFTDEDTWDTTENTYGSNKDKYDGAKETAEVALYDPEAAATAAAMYYSGNYVGAQFVLKEAKDKEERKQADKRQRQKEQEQQWAKMQDEDSQGSSGGGSDGGVDWTDWIDDVWDWLTGDSGGSSGEEETKKPRDSSSEDSFDWSKIIGPLLTAGAGGVGNYIEGSLDAATAKEALEQKRQSELMNLQLEALKASMEKPMNPTPVWAPGKLGLDDRVNAKQSAANSKTSQLNALISAYQNGMR